MQTDHQTPADRRTAPTPELAMKLALARTLAVTCWPYLTTALLRMAPRWDERAPPLAVDQYWRLYLKPSYVATLTPPQLALLIVGHELRHCLGGHSDRLVNHRHTMIVTPGGAVVNVTNAAQDLAINCGLEEYGTAANEYRRQSGDKATFDFTWAPPPGAPPGAKRTGYPPDGLYPRNFTDRRGRPFPDGLIAEDYAELLVQSCPQAKPAAGCGDDGDGDGDGDGSGKKAGKGSGKKADKTAGGKTGDGRPDHQPAGAGCGRCGSGAGGPKGEWEDPDPPVPGDATTGTTPAEQDNIIQAVAEAARDQARQGRGTVPGGLEQWARLTLKQPVVPWRRVFQRKIRGAVNWATGMADYSYRRHNRRTVATGSAVILPGMYKPNPKILLGFDSSGSMSHADYEASFSEAAGILKVYGIFPVPVVSCDTVASEVQWVRRVEDIKMVGGGGTDMGAVVAAAQRVKDVRLLVIFTDGVTGYGDPPVNGMRVVVCLTRPPMSCYPIPDWIDWVRAYDTE